MPTLNVLPPLPLLDGHLVFDNSALSLLDCPRKFYLSYMRRRVLAVARAGRNFGSTLHVGWAVRYRKAGSELCSPEVVMESHDAMRKWMDENPQPMEDFRNFGHACAVFDAYLKQYPREPFKIITLPGSSLPLVERSFALPLGEVDGYPIIYTGKLDIGVEDVNNIWSSRGGVWSFDHKTAFQFGDTFEKQMSRDSGQVGYTWALQETLGPDVPVNGYIIDAVRIRRPAKRKNALSEYSDGSLGQAPVDATDFVRIPHTVTPDDIDRWKQNALYKIHLILTMYKDGYFPEFESQCTGKYGACDYIECCSVARDFRESVLASNVFEDNTWSPLNKPNGDEGV